MPTIPRASLREAVRDAVVDRIISGDLQAGRAVGEVALGAELGVSRTPLREALIELQQQGLLQQEPGRGFIVPPLTLAELREIYPIIATLDALAIDLTTEWPDELLERLRRLNDRLEESTPARRAAIDEEWHATLVRASTNQRLITMSLGLRRIVRRYEARYLREEKLARNSAREHSAIIRALERGRPREAATLVRKHWESSVESLIRLLRGEQASNAAK